MLHTVPYEGKHYMVKYYVKIAALIEPTRITDKTMYDSYMGIRAYHEDVIVAQIKRR